MKYFATLALLGLIGSTDARVPNALALQTRNLNFNAIGESSSSSSSSDGDALVQLDAEVAVKQPCEYLDET